MFAYGAAYIGIIVSSMTGLTKRGTQIALGVLWLFDGVLQLQHQMFTSNFATQVIEPAEQGQPTFVSGPMHLGVHVFLMHPAIFNALFVLTQLTLGVLILWKRTTKMGLLLSVPWGLIVWVLGEGYGGILSGKTSLLMGAPGAAILYVILALAILPTDKKPGQTAYWLALVWLVIWVGGGVYQLLPGQNSTTNMGSMIAANIDGSPKWLGSTDRYVVHGLKYLGGAKNDQRSVSSVSGMNMTAAQMSHMSNQTTMASGSGTGGLYILLFALLQFCIGIGVLFKGIMRNTVIVLGLIVSLIIWVVGESLGGYFTGMMTDPNSAPLLIIMGLAIAQTLGVDSGLAGVAAKIQALTVGSPSNS